METKEVTNQMSQLTLQATQDTAPPTTNVPNKRDWQQILRLFLTRFPNACLFGGGVRDIIAEAVPRDLDFQVFDEDTFYEAEHYFNVMFRAKMCHPAKKYPWMHSRGFIDTLPIDLVYKPTDTNVDMDINGCQLWYQENFFRFVNLYATHSDEMVAWEHPIFPILCESSCLDLMHKMKSKQGDVWKLDTSIMCVRVIQLLSRGWKLSFFGRELTLKLPCKKCKHKLFIGASCLQCLPIIKK
jgi:hypothetical protein